LCLFLHALVIESKAQENVSDNSFLIEEAYNQEPGVVQHIHLAQFSTEGDGIICSFTQEWPLAGMKHQVSYTIPYSLSPNTELQDIQINYRYQVLSSKKVSVAPRLTVQLPTAASVQNRGIIFNLPASFILSKKAVMHLNGGAGQLWSSLTDENNKRIMTSAYNLGGNIVYHFSTVFDALTEVVHNSFVQKSSGGVSVQSFQLLLNPGLRYAFNFNSGMQIVPGASYLMDLTNEVNYMLFYFSVEHPFKKTKS
jgi:hypothetical protein